MAQPFDNRRLELKGQATPVAEQWLMTGRRRLTEPFRLQPMTSWFTGEAQRQTGSSTWYDRQGKILGTAGEPAITEGWPSRRMGRAWP